MTRALDACRNALLIFSPTETCLLSTRGIARRPASRVDECGVGHRTLRYGRSRCRAIRSVSVFSIAGGLSLARFRTVPHFILRCRRTVTTQIQRLTLALVASLMTISLGSRLAMTTRLLRQARNQCAWSSRSSREPGSLTIHEQTWGKSQDR